MLGDISQIPVLEKHRTLILLKKSVNGEKLYFMKVILLYLVLEKLVFRAFQNVGSTTVLLLVYKAFSEHFFPLSFFVIIP